jgi:hypothetical protein
VLHPDAELAQLLEMGEAERADLERLLWIIPGRSAHHRTVRAMQVNSDRVEIESVPAMTLVCASPYPDRKLTRDFGLEGHFTLAEIFCGLRGLLVIF